MVLMFGITAGHPPEFFEVLMLPSPRLDLQVKSYFN